MLHGLRIAHVHLKGRVLILLGLLQDVHREEVPEVQADLEQFHVLLDASALDQVVQASLGALPQSFDVLIGIHSAACLLDQSQVLRKHRRDGNADLFSEVLEMSLLLRVEQGLVLGPQVSVFGDCPYLLYEDTEKDASLLLVKLLLLLFLIVEWDDTDLSEEFDSVDSSAGRSYQIPQHILDQLSLKDVAQRDPRKVSLHGLETLPHEGIGNALRVLNGLSDNLITELEDGLELGSQLVLQLLGILTGYRVFREVKHVLRQQLEDVQGVLAALDGFLGILADLRDEVGPVVRPLMLHYRD